VATEAAVAMMAEGATEVVAMEAAEMVVVATVEARAAEGRVQVAMAAEDWVEATEAAATAAAMAAAAKEAEGKAAEQRCRRRRRS
jgi:hypothetical protein